MKPNVEAFWQVFVETVPDPERRHRLGRRTALCHRDDYCSDRTFWKRLGRLCSYRGRG